MDQSGLRNLSVWEHFTTIGAIVWLSFVIIVGAIWDDDIGWTTDVQSALVMCSLIFIFRDQFSLARWPETILFLVCFLEFGRFISRFVGISEDPFLTDRGDKVDLGDDCAFTVAKLVFVVTLLLALSLWGIGRLKLQFSFAWAIRCVGCLCLTVAVLRLSRSNSWLHHNFSYLSMVYQATLPFVITELARISLFVSIAILAISSTSQKGFLSSIILMIGGLFIVGFSEWYIWDRFVAEEAAYLTPILGSEYAKEFINTSTTDNTIGRFRSRIVEFTAVFVYCLILVSTNKRMFKKDP